MPAHLSIAESSTTRSPHPQPPRPPSDPDAAGAVLERLVAGDEATWADVVRQYRTLVRNLARGYRIGVHEVDDVEQRVWLLLYEHAGGIRDPRCLPGWIATTTRHEGLAVLRRRRRGEVTTAALPDVAADLPDPAEALIAGERAAALRQAIDRLPPRQSRLLAALAEDNCSYQEISDRLGIPVGSIGPTRARAFDRLRELVCA
jgi:RNA polymerase sigma factor (sigma-70 family)